MGGAFGAEVAVHCGSPRVEPEWKRRAAADITASERLGPDAVRDSGTSDLRFRADREEAAARPSVGGGATVCGPKTWLTTRSRRGG